MKSSRRGADCRRAVITSCRLNSTVLLCLLCVAVPGHRFASLSPPSAAADDDEETLVQNARWLDDFDTVLRQEEVNDYDRMQADSPFGHHAALLAQSEKVTAHRKWESSIQTAAADDENEDDAPRCPPPILPSSLIRSWCAAASSSTGAHRCQSDNDCRLPTSSSAPDRKRKCCYDGCQRVCTAPIDPAPYVDWKREPQTRLTAGKSWLIQGPEEPEEVEWCTTSYVYYDVTADEEPLLCPSGYTCFIDDPGDINNGVPNRGRCVPEPTGLSSERTSNFQLATLNVGTNGLSCAVTNVTYSDGDKFKYEKHTCTCDKGSVMCRVGKKTRRRGRRKKKGRQSI